MREEIFKVLEKKGKGREVEREKEVETRVLQYAALRLNVAQNKNSEGSILALSSLEIPISLRLSALPLAKADIHQSITNHQSPPLELFQDLGIRILKSIGEISEAETSSD